MFFFWNFSAIYKKNSLAFSNRLYWEKGFTINHWAKTIILLTTMIITGCFAFVIIKFYVDPMIRILTAGIAILIGYICIKLLGENTMMAYQRAKVSSINIINGDPSTEKLHTICQDVQCHWTLSDKQSVSFSLYFISPIPDWSNVIKKVKYLESFSLKFHL